MEYNIYPSNIEIESHNTIAVTLQKKIRRQEADRSGLHQQKDVI